jgi:hypothetical protein
VINRLFSGMLSSNNGRQSANSTDRITIRGHTYITKPIPDEDSATGGVTGQAPIKQLVAFNGNKYVLISQSNTMYIVVLTEGRRGTSWLTDALGWLAKLCRALVKKHY